MRRLRRSGVTLIELLVTIVISAVIGGTIVTVLMSQMQLSATQNRTMINSQNLRETLDYMADEISNAGAGTTEPFIDTATATELRFVGDIDGDGQWNRVRYYVSQGNLKRTLWSSTNAGTSWNQDADDVLLTGVTTLAFTYYKRGNAAPAANSEITLVQVALTQDPDKDTRAFSKGRVPTGRMAIRATIRNRMLN